MTIGSCCSSNPITQAIQSVTKPEEFQEPKSPIEANAEQLQTNAQDPNAASEAIKEVTKLPDARELQTISALAIAPAPTADRGEFVSFSV